MGVMTSPLALISIGATFRGREAAAARGYVDSVIEPASARKQLLYAFEMLYNKCEYPIGKKHGTI